MSTDRNFVVYKSSAGSGKTFTIARIFLSLTLKSKNPTYFKHILAITFTVKAAAEMKQRIIQYLSGFAGRKTDRKDILAMQHFVLADINVSESELKTRSEATLLQILHNYGDLSVLTIDKFIHRLVRTFASDLDLTADFEVEIDDGKLNKTVVDELMDRLGSNSEITKVILDFVDRQTDDEKYWDISKALMSLANELNSEEFFQKASHLPKLSPTKMFEIRTWLNTEIEKVRLNIESQGDSALEIIAANGLEPADFYQGNRGVFAFFKSASETQFQKLLHENNYVKKTIEENKWQSGTKNASVLAISEELILILGRILESRTQIRKGIFYESIKSNLNLMALIEELQTLFSEHKREENIQTLGDFYQILSSKFNREATPFIYERLGNHYKHIMIDEFQDTSALQWKNLMPLVVNSLSEAHKSVIVGDAKQSIYRFRGSEPTQFINLPGTQSEAGLLFEKSYSEEKLDTNFRSANAVIGFNNRFFEAFNAGFLSEESAKAYVDIEQKSSRKTKGKVIVHTVEKLENEPRKDAMLAAILERTEQASFSPNISLGEICILFRTNADASFVASGLLQAGFKVVSSESLLLMNNPKVQLIISCLYAHNHNSNPFYLQQFLARYHQNALLEENYHAAAEWILTKKASLQKLCNRIHLPLDLALLNNGDIYNNISYLTRFFKLNLNDAFIQKLLDFSLDFTKSSNNLKHSFFSFWESEQESLSISADYDTNAIRIMSIHKSKGLEFPIVFLYLPDIAVKNTTQEYAWIDTDSEIPDLPFALLPMNALADTPHEGILEIEKQLSNLDFTNALYVALTRAEKQLEIFTMRKDEGISSKPLQFLTEWPEWNQETKSLILED
jgi:ATP-dependent exoDNAse (exonuclease V) beta subunit